jgi:ATP-binding cassette subfamily B (MDR/TAP) protein 1
LIKYYWPTIPHKIWVFLGLLSAVAHGVSTPIWSFFIAKLMAIVGAGGTDPDLTKCGIVLLAICLGQALVYFSQEYLLFCQGSRWTGVIRNQAFEKVLKQDKGWFDESNNSPARLVQTLIKDADDIRQIVGSVLGKIVVFISMVGLGIGWALVVDWRLTLVGLALGPLFGAMMVLQDSLVGRAEVVNKARREEVARTFYEVSFRGLWSPAKADNVERLKCPRYPSDGAGQYLLKAIRLGRGERTADRQARCLVCCYRDRGFRFYALVRARSVGRRPR